MVNFLILLYLIINGVIAYFGAVALGEKLIIDDETGEVTKTSIAIGIAAIILCVFIALPLALILQLKTSYEKYKKAKGRNSKKSRRSK